MSFQGQHGSIVNELRRLGMSSDAATRLASILGNSDQTTLTGPQTQDLTPKSLRYVDGQTRKLQLSNLDFREGDPDFVIARTQPGQEAVRPLPISSLQTSQSPQARAASLGVSGGNFTSVKSKGDSVQVGLNIKQTGNLVAINEGGNQLIGKTLRVDAKSLEDSGLTASLDTTGNELVIKISIDLEALANALLGTGLFGEGGDRDYNPDPNPGGGGGQSVCDTSPDRTTVVTGVSCVNGSLVVTTGTLPTTACS